MVLVLVGLVLSQTPAAPGEKSQELCSERVLAQLPAGVTEFEKLFQEQAQTPEDALKLWFDAIMLSIDPPTRERGLVMLGQATWSYRDQPDWRRSGLGSSLYQTLRNRPYLFNSYTKGASPTNGYAVDPNNYRLDILSSRARDDGDRYTVILACSGDTPRQVVLRRDPESMLYYVENFSGLLGEIQAPVGPTLRPRW